MRGSWSSWNLCNFLILWATKDHTFSSFQLPYHLFKNNIMVKIPCLSTLLDTLWTLNPISVVTFSILSNKSLGGCVDVNRIFLWATSCSESSNHKNQENCSCFLINTQLWICRYPDMFIGVMFSGLYDLERKMQWWKFKDYLSVATIVLRYNRWLLDYNSSVMLIELCKIFFDCDLGDI